MITGKPLSDHLAALMQMFVAQPLMTASVRKALGKKASAIHILSSAMMCAGSCPRCLRERGSMTNYMRKGTIPQLLPFSVHLLKNMSPPILSQHQS